MRLGEALCERTFGMRPHQVKHMLETFTTETIADAFLLHGSQVTEWRRRLGIPPMKRGISTFNGMRRPVGRGHPLRAFA